MTGFRKRAIAVACLALAAPVVIVSSADAAGTGQPGWYTLQDDSLSGRVTASVNAANGNLLVEWTDVVPTVETFQVGLTRYYNSQGSSTAGALGPRWSWDVGPDVRVVDRGQSLDLVGPTGDTTTFTQQSDGSYSAPDEYNGTLARQAGGGFVLARAAEGDRYMFEPSGSMTSRIDDPDTFTVQTTSAAGRTLLGSFGTPATDQLQL